MLFLQWCQKCLRLAPIKKIYKTSKTRTATSNNVFVSIVIEKDGSVTFDKIARGVDKNHDKEAKRIAENMPNWSSGYLDNGDKVRVVMMFPIWFVK